MWRKIATIKKTLFINVYNNQTVNIASMTNGVGWSNSNCVYGTSGVSPKHNIYKSEIFCNKVNDNVYKFNFRNSKYSQVLRRGVFYRQDKLNQSVSFYQTFNDLKHMQMNIKIFCSLTVYPFDEWFSGTLDILLNGNVFTTVVYFYDNYENPRISYDSNKILAIDTTFQTVVTPEEEDVEMPVDILIDCKFAIILSETKHTNLEIRFKNSIGELLYPDAKTIIELSDMEYIDLTTTDSTSGKGEVIFYEQN